MVLYDPACFWSYLFKNVEAGASVTRIVRVKFEDFHKRLRFLLEDGIRAETFTSVYVFYWKMVFERVSSHLLSRNMD